VRPDRLAVRHEPGKHEQRAEKDEIVTRQNPEIDGGQPLEVLARDDCVEFLTNGSFVGRLGLVVDRRPLVLPVNYMVDRGTVVFCTAAGTKLNAIVGGADVAFEVDEHRSLRHSGWSVLVRGRAEIVTDNADLAHLRAGPLRPWAKGARANWVRIPLDEVSGRRIPPI
jgi:nitroimidazol reductase NimA-like FMN-containing flavoprotein (pyridoxamine 5'-phosphate oxidase superfamily)